MTVRRRTIDRRTSIRKQLAAWCIDLAADLGVVDQPSTQQRAFFDEAVKLKLMSDSVDAWVRATVARQPQEPEPMADRP